MLTLYHPIQMKNSNKKCGEITYCIQVGKRVYALNCLYCSQIFLQWDLFINHMDLEHDILNLDSVLNEEENETNLQENLINNECSKVLQQNTNNSLFNKIDNTDQLPFNDPLEDENSINSMSMIETNVDNDKIEIDNNDDRISEQNYNCNGQDLNDDFLSQSSSSSYNDDNNGDKNFVYDKRKFTELIIKYYKDHPVLWQSNHSEHKNISKHQEVYKKITKLINKELNLNLKCIQIKGKINKLRSKFRKEHEFLMEFSNCNENDMDLDDISTSPNNTSWLYEQMSFLKDYINDSRKRSKRGSKALTNDKNYLPIAKFSLEENQQFVELYKSYPCLWDINHIGFRFKNQRQESLQDLLEAVNKQLNLDLSLEDVQKKLYCIRYAVTQEKHRQIECETLKIEFTPQCKLYNELLFLKDSVGPFKCEYCEQIFNGPDQYKVHKSSHDGSMPYSCPQCNKGFMKIGNCTVHLRRHNKDFQFECQECGKKFPTSTDLNVHTRLHSGEKPYFCDICGQSFRTWTYFDSHRRRHEKKPNHICTICSKGFYEHNKLKQHIKSHMNVRDKVCNVCGKSFTCTKYLNQHKLTHAEKKKYSCKICDKKFAQHGGLSNHIKSHNTIVGNESIKNDV